MEFQKYLLQTCKSWTSFKDPTSLKNDFPIYEFFILNKYYSASNAYILTNVGHM